MKAKEIIGGRKAEKVADLPVGARDVMPPSMVVPDLNGYYELYRMLISLAGLPDNSDTPMSSVVRDSPYIAPYSTYEYDAVLKMLSKMGKIPKNLSTRPSQESDDVNKASPVRKFKDYTK